MTTRRIKINSPKLCALLRVKLCMTLAPKKDHFRRNSCARFLKDRPFCLLGYNKKNSFKHLLVNAVVYISVLVSSVVVFFFLIIQSVILVFISNHWQSLFFYFSTFSIVKLLTIIYNYKMSSNEFTLSLYIAALFCQ